MQEIVEDLERWRRAGLRTAVARVVDVEGSGPRQPGATMAVNELGEVAGSVSGGCVEGAVVTDALEALTDGRARLRSYGYSDDEAFAVGLTCGGTVHLLVQPALPPVYDKLRRAIAAERPVVLATVVGAESATADESRAPAGPTPERGRSPGRPAAESGTLPALGACLLAYEDGRVEGSLGTPELDALAARDARGALTAGRSASRHYDRCGDDRPVAVRLFFEVFASPPRLVIVGAMDFTAALARIGKLLGYRVTVCDARPVFATPARFPMADEVVAQRPERYLADEGPGLGPRDAVCVLTHDAKFDVPAIMAALATEVGYIGALGSRRTHADRQARLSAAGVGDDGLRRVMAPIGLDIGARTPEETAVSIVAEMIALRAGAVVPSLRDGTGPIHRDADAVPERAP